MSDTNSQSNDHNSIIFEDGDLQVLVNKDFIEPEQFFTIIKAGKAGFNQEELNGQLLYLANEIKKARTIGQDRFVERAEFLARAIVKEKLLHDMGITQFVKREAVVEFAKKVKPINSVKIIELNRYPRVIPDEVVNKIKVVKDANIFDDYIVVFTDLTKNDYKTKSERKFVERNRDPIIFGIFKEDKSEIHDRMYMIADWQDAFCDLTFDKMLNNISDTNHGVVMGDVKKIIDSYSDVEEAYNSDNFFSLVWSKAKVAAKKITNG